MCSGSEQSKSTSSSSPAVVEEASDTKDISQMNTATNHTVSSLLELAANNDFEGFEQLMGSDVSAVDGVALWCVTKRGSRRIVREDRTPLMVAATYGSVDVLKLILSQPKVDVNNSCGQDQSTGLHCAASGGSVNAVDVVKLLLSAGANPNAVDANGLRPLDVVAISPKLPGLRVSLEELLKNNATDSSVDHDKLLVSIDNSVSNSPTLSLSPRNGSPGSPSDLVSSPPAAKYNDRPANPGSEKKEYLLDPTLPDINNSIYSTDEFRMFSFKVRPCSRAYSHDWTECPFVHPGENARRRDPRKYHYSCVPCPDFRKGNCKRADMCEYAHGVFECWLHPAQYRTRLCKDGTSCARRVCFFAHTPEELRPFHVSTGSAVPSPRSGAASASAMDMAAALSLLPGSPSSVMSPSLFNPPLSPSLKGISHSSVAWPQPNVPTLSLPGGNLQSSRLRSSLSARDISLQDLNLLTDFDTPQQVLNDLSCFSQGRSNFASLSRSCLSKSLTPSNLEELFSAELGSSPRYSDQASGGFPPSPRSAVVNLNHLHQPQNMLSPINTSAFAPKNVEHPLLQTSFGVSSPRCMSPRGEELISPLSARISALTQHEKQKQQLRSLSSRDLGSKMNFPIVGSPLNFCSTWGSPNGKANWSFENAELGQLRKSSSLEVNNHGDEPDLSWVQSLVKESPPGLKDKKQVVPVSGFGSPGEAVKSNFQVESTDHSVLGAWLDQMQLDQLVA